MFRIFYPDDYVDSAYHINYEKLYSLGYRGLLFDIDNTLVEHGADATPKVKKLFEKLGQMGFSCCLISNNKEERVRRFNQDIGVHYVYKAHKPTRRGYELAMKKMKTDLNHTIFIGDQIFTDVFGAKRIGMKTILVKPVGKKEEIQIVIKRFFEKIVMKRYHMLRNNR